MEPVGKVAGDVGDAAEAPEQGGRWLLADIEKLNDLHRLSAGVEHLPVAGVYRHAGADGGLGEVYGGDVARLHVRQSPGEFGAEGGEELAAGGEGGGGGGAAADEDDAGGEGVGAFSDHSIGKLGSQRPSASDGEARMYRGIQKDLPARAGRSSVPFCLGLLKGVIDSDRKRRVCLLGQAG